MTSGTFFRSARVVLLGMVVAQAIPLLGSLVIARLYAPAEFGAFAAWLGGVATAAVLVTGRLEMALVIEADGEPRRFAMAATLATICGVSVLLFLIVVAMYFIVPEANHFNSGLLLALLPATLLTAVVQTWQSWAAADGLYRDLSWIRIMQALGVTGVQVMFGWFAPSALGLAMGNVLGLLIGVIAAACMMPISLRVFLPWALFKPKLITFWAKHRRFPLFSLPADLINSISWQLPLILIASRFGAESSGYFAMAIRVLGAPVGMLGNALLDVFKRKASSSFRENGNCTSDFLGLLRVLAVFGILFAIVGALLVEELFVIAYGETWRRAGVVATWLLPLFAFRFVASPLSYVFYLTQGQSVDLIWQCALLTMTVTVMVWLPDFESAVTVYAIGYSALYVVYLYLAYRFSKGPLGTSGAGKK